MDAVIYFISAPFEPFEFNNGCNYYIFILSTAEQISVGLMMDVIIIIIIIIITIVSVPFKPFELDDRCNYYILFQLHSNPFELDNGFNYYINISLTNKSSWSSGDCYIHWGIFIDSSLINRSITTNIGWSSPKDYLRQFKSFIEQSNRINLRLKFLHYSNRVYLRLELSTNRSIVCHR